MKRLALILAVVCALGGATYAALPLTPSTTYVPNSTPVIKAADLNALQVYLAGLYSSLYSVKALVVDGTGGASVTGVAGTVKVSATVSGYNAVAPFATASVPWGQAAKEQVMLGAARCRVIATVLQDCGGFNIKSVSRIGVGQFRVEFNTAGPNADRHVVSATAENSSPVFATVDATPSIVAGALRVDVRLYDLTGTGVDTTVFHVMATGG